MGIGKKGRKGLKGLKGRGSATERRGQNSEERRRTEGENWEAGNGKWEEVVKSGRGRTG